MTVRVRRVQIPALGTLGYGFGADVETGREVSFCGDHRPMRGLAEVLQLTTEMPLVEIEPWQVLTGL